MNIEEIRKKAKSTGVNTQVKYSCNLCRDTGWIIKDNKAYECECARKARLARKWKRFGVDPAQVKLIKEYKCSSEIQKRAKAKAINYIKNYNTNNSLAFLGQPGAGKTHLALAIGRVMLEKGKEVVYMPFLEDIKELKGNALDEYVYNKLQSKYINADLLIIDDLFKDKIKGGELASKLTETDIKHVYPIINQRYINNRHTIYSSECNAQMLLELDEALAGRILESCQENIIIFKKSIENNYRLRFLNS